LISGRGWTTVERLEASTRALFRKRYLGRAGGWWTETNEGATVPTWNSSMAERGALGARLIRNRALAYIIGMGRRFGFFFSIVVKIIVHGKKKIAVFFTRHFFLFVLLLGVKFLRVHPFSTMLDGLGLLLGGLNNESVVSSSTQNPEQCV
jgi:hypothetical protein